MSITIHRIKSIGGGAQLLLHPNTDEVTGSVMNMLSSQGVDPKNIRLKPVPGSRLVRMNVRGATPEGLQAMVTGKPQIELSVS